jgi:ubiquitin-like 1-activating enzyme E1 A
MQRVTAAQPRIQALNPRVQVTASVDASILSSEQELAKFDLVCLTDSDPATIVSEELALTNVLTRLQSKVNALCRQVNTKLYAGSSLGFSGYIFADLAEHDYTVSVALRSPKASADGRRTASAPTRRRRSNQGSNRRK